MVYQFEGVITKANCTPAPMTPFDNRSCRERTGCTKECNPKTLKCEKCGEMFSLLCLLENIETKEQVSVCRRCEKILMSE